MPFMNPAGNDFCHGLLDLTNAYLFKVDLTEASYQEVLQKGLSIKSQIAIPVKGNYFLRLGVHNVDGDQIGALEIPMDQVRLDAAGSGVAQAAAQRGQTP